MSVNFQWSDITCGAACWEAKELDCKCSCGGKNHGIALLGKNPEKVVKISGRRYKLHSVGFSRELETAARGLRDAKGFGISRIDATFCYHYQRDSLAIVRRASGGQLKWLEVVNFDNPQNKEIFVLFIPENYAEVEPKFCDPKFNCEKCARAQNQTTEV